MVKYMLFADFATNSCIHFRPLSPLSSTYYCLHIIFLCVIKNLNLKGATKMYDLQTNINHFDSLLSRYSETKNTHSFSRDEFSKCNDLFETIMKQINVSIYMNMATKNENEFNKNYIISDQLKYRLFNTAVALVCLFNSIKPLNPENIKHKENIKSTKDGLNGMFKRIFSIQKGWKSDFQHLYPPSNPSKTSDYSNSSRQITSADSFNTSEIKPKDKLKIDIDDFVDLLSGCNEIKNFPKEKFQNFISTRFPDILKQMNVIIFESMKLHDINQFIEITKISKEIRSKLNETSLTLVHLFNSSFTNSKEDAILGPEVTRLQNQMKMLYDQIESLEREWSLATQEKKRPTLSFSEANQLSLSFSTPKISSSLTQLNSQKGAALKNVNKRPHENNIPQTPSKKLKIDTPILIQSPKFVVPEKLTFGVRMKKTISKFEADQSIASIHKIRGIENINNSSAVIAAIQALASSPEIVCLILKIDLDDIECSKYKFAKALKELFAEYTHPASTADSFEDKISAFKDHLKGTTLDQNDAASRIIEEVLEFLELRVSPSDKLTAENKTGFDKL